MSSLSLIFRNVYALLDGGGGERKVFSEKIVHFLDIAKQVMLICHTIKHRSLNR